MTEQNQAENNKKLARLSARAVTLIAVLTFLLGLGISSAWQFFFADKMEEIRFGGLAALLAPAAEVPSPLPVVEVTEFVVNIVSEYEPRYARLSLALALDQETTRDEINLRMAQIRDTVVLLINSKTFEELQDSQGKLQLKAELKSVINKFLATGQLNEVYLTDFVVQ